VYEIGGFKSKFDGLHDSIDKRLAKIMFGVHFQDMVYESLYDVSATVKAPITVTRTH
jgi:hypothetical protein